MEDLAPSSSTSFRSERNLSANGNPSPSFQSPTTVDAHPHICHALTFLFSSLSCNIFNCFGNPREINNSNTDQSLEITPASSPRTRENQNQNAATNLTPSSRPYDIFINHRGPDVKKSLASIIHYVLQDKGFQVFFDTQELRPGQQLNSTIEDAIRSSSVHVAIFSKRYAESRWCLDELCLMLKTEAVIIPVFYDVRPADLRRVENGAYGSAFAEHKRNGRYDSRIVSEWKAALEKVSHYSGLDLQGKFRGDQGELLKTLVDNVSEHVKRRVPLAVAKDAIGLDEAIRDFEEFMVENGQHIENQTVRIVGIVGLTGSGKTTLAKEFYNRTKGFLFNRYSFLFDVRDHAAKKTLLTLQIQLLKDLRVIDNKLPVNSLAQGKGILQHKLKSSSSSSPVLIILDDIDHETQLEDLLEKDVFERGSLILLTSRDEGTLRSAGASSIYRIKGLDPDHARELFCLHAFNKPHPMNGFEDLVGRFCRKCGGLPLFLKVMGAHLRDNADTNKDDWEDELEHIPEGIEQMLRISYDALQKEEKQIFLDIACFFLGEDRSLATRVWDRSEGKGSRRLKRLENKCLVEFDDRNRLKMHDHIRDFGREIAKEEPAYRLWHPDLIADNQEQLKGGKEVRGIVAAKRYPEHTDFDSYNSFDGPWSYQPLLEEILSDIKLSSLKFLVIKSDCFEDRLCKRCTDLIWLRWYNCPHTNISPWLSMKNLTVLQILGGNVEGWQPGDKKEIHRPEYLSKLRTLDIISCDGLHMLTNLADLSSLETLRAIWCYRLHEIQDLQHLRKLQKLDISGCRELHELPNLANLSSLETIKLSGCRKLHKIQGLEHLRKLQELDISECSELRELPNLAELSALERLRACGCSKLQKLQGLEHLRKLQELDISTCCELRELPTLADLSSLEMLRPYGCSKLQKIQGLKNLRRLKMLDISKCSELRELPSLADLSSLERVIIHGCGKLQKIQELKHLRKLQTLDIRGCFELHGLPNLADLSSLERLLVHGCSKLQKIQGLEDLRKLQTLDIRSCCELRGLPDLADLSFLERLIVHGCSKLQKIQGLEHLRKLQTLDVRNCCELRGLPDLADLSSLERLIVHGCSTLQNIQGLELLQKLQMLDISGCCELHELPNLAGFSSLETLKACGCGKLHKVQGLEHLPKLQMLDVSGCCELHELPNLAALSSLETLKASGCSKLHKIQGREHLPKHQELDIDECCELQELPNPEDLPSLETFRPHGSSKLQKIQGLEHRRKLQILDISSCCELHELPYLADFSSLKRLIAYGCSKLQKIEGLEHLRKLQTLDISSCCELHKVANLEDLSSLETLKASGCSKLHEIQGLERLRKLQNLSINECSELQNLPNLADLSALETLIASGCSKLEKIDGLEHLRKLQVLDISSCSELQELPNLKDLSSLETLKASGCSKLHEIQGLEHLQKLQNLCVNECSELQELPNLADLSSLKRLEAYGCSKLRKIQGLEHLRKLQMLDVSRCCQFHNLPNLADLNSLETLSVSGCSKLESIQGLDHLLKLEMLDISECSKLREVRSLGHLSELRTLNISGLSELHELPNLANLTSLRRFVANGCWKLHGIQGLDNLQHLKSLTLSADDSQAIWNSVQRLKKLPSKMCLSGRAPVNPISFPNLTVIDLKFSVRKEDDSYQYWSTSTEGGNDGFLYASNSRTVKCAGNICLGAGMMCFVIQSTAGAAIEEEISFSFDLACRFRVNVREGEWICIHSFSLSGKYLHTNSTYVVNLDLLKEGPTSGIEIKKGWMVIVNQGNEAMMFEVMKRLLDQ